MWNNSIKLLTLSKVVIVKQQTAFFKIQPGY